MQTSRPSDIPQRLLLSDQVVGVLRTGLERKRWTGELPGESKLCRELRVSRVTLRKAIARLAREGWIELGGQGRRHRVLKRGRKSARNATGTVIRVLSPFSVWQIGATIQTLLKSIAERVGAEGFRLEFEHHPRVYEKHLPDELARLDALPDTAAWLLFFSTKPMQEWFAGCGRACVNAGMLHEGVKLPAAVMYNEVQSRHAAGLLFSRGHRVMVYLIAEFTSQGDRVGSEAFADEGRRLGADVEVLTYDPKPQGVAKVVASVLARQPRPTAIHLTCPEDCVTILCQLQRAGIRVPGEIDLLCGWDDLILEYTMPVISRYRIDPDKYGKRIGAMLLDVIRRGPGKPRELRMMSEFVPGGTLSDAAGRP